MHIPAHVRNVLFHVPLDPAGGGLILAEMDDDRLCILQNGRPLRRCRWDAADLAKAVAAFQELNVLYRRPDPPRPS